MQKKQQHYVANVKQLLDEYISSYVFDNFNLTSVYPLACKSSAEILTPLYKNGLTIWITLFFTYV